MAGLLTRRALVQGALGLAGLVALGGCGQGAGQDEGGRVTVTAWGPYGGPEQTMVDVFNAAQTEVLVQYTAQDSYDALAQRLRVALQLNTPPDVVVLSDLHWFGFYLDGLLQPLDGLFAGAGIDPKTYVDVFFQEGVRQGQSYWVPLARSVPLFYYNQSLWAEAGLPERGPETWEEFLGWVPQLVKKQGRELRQAAFGYGSTTDWLFQSMVWQFGGALSKPDFTMTMTEPGTIAAGAFYADSLRQEGWQPYSQDMEQFFLDGKVAATMRTSAALPTLLSKATFPLGAAVLPRAETFGCATGGAGMSILAQAPPERQAAALRWIAFATSLEMTLQWFQQTGYLPVQQAALEHQALRHLLEEQPAYRAAVAQLPLAQRQDVARAFVPGGSEILARSLERVVAEPDAVAPIFAEANAALENAAAPVRTAVQTREG